MPVYRPYRLRLGPALVTLSACAFGLAGTSCRAPTPVRAGGPLEACATPYERDLPVPVGFELRAQSSEDFLTGPLRYLRHEYTGRADKRAVRDFYRRQMPLVRWTPISDSLVAGRYTMRFERGTETCLVTIEDEPGRAAGGVRAQVIIAPRVPPQTPAP